jgi:hypothetical protein
LARRLAVAAIVLLVAAPAAMAAPTGPHFRHRQKLWRNSFAAAERYASHRLGRVAFAVVDDQGALHRFHPARRYYSASLVKAMLLVSYLNRGPIRNRPLPSVARANLHPMITRSDNGAASRIFRIVGQRGLRRLARRTAMEHFATSPAWGDTLLAAADQARFFARIDALVPSRHRRYALGLLSHVIAPQRWGIPQVVSRPARVYFKGGWRPIRGGWVVNQGALVIRGRRRASIAVLTDHDRSEGYGHETIRGIARRALRPLALP